MGTGTGLRCLPRLATGAAAGNVLLYPNVMALLRLCATLSYDDAGRLEQIDYSNGAREIRVYDDADRLTEIRHEDAAEDALHKTMYVWTINNWVEQRTEVDYTVTPSTSTVVDFEYDNRGRLISETRTVGQEDVYDISYTYDQLGNRQTKIDAVNGQWVVYDYDVDLADPNELEFPTWHNRLLEYRMYDGDPNDPNTSLLRTVSYTYYKTGQASNITLKDGGEGSEYDTYHDLALYYHSHGPLWRALWGSYELDEQQEPTGYETSWAREFSYDSPRERILAAEYDTVVDEVGSDDPKDWTWDASSVWTEYAGVLPYTDLETDRDVADPNHPAQYEYERTEVLRYLGTAAQQTAGTNETAFLHGDLIGSTNLTTDDDGDALQTPAVAYTAFGEVIGNASTLATRYQYAGAWGYESDLLVLEGVNPNLPAITLQHVGARWYQPDLGRFVQRDPIGIDGGFNVYEYASSRPPNSLDPSGLWSWENASIGGLGGMIAGAGTGNPVAPLLAGVAGVLVGGYEKGDSERLSNAINSWLDDFWESISCIDHRRIWTYDDLVEEYPDIKWPPRYDPKVVP